ncbi:hypothetical protein HMSSN139_40140 [Paenibacillus sp. HMSSN-139]|nr:hypothetical protein HMSSN139_40140 [Paenibacillus sp. HMSSN-139]
MQTNPLFHDEHRDPGMLDDVMADAAKHEFADAAQSAAADDDQIRPVFWAYSRIVSAGAP